MASKQILIPLLLVYLMLGSCTRDDRIINYCAEFNQGIEEAKKNRYRRFSDPFHSRIQYEDAYAEVINKSVIKISFTIKEKDIHHFSDAYIDESIRQAFKNDRTTRGLIKEGITFDLDFQDTDNVTFYTDRIDLASIRQ